MEESNELCATCSKIDLFSLFTGPRYYPGDGYEHKFSIPLGTLAEIDGNKNCTFCRLLYHDIYEIGYHDYWFQEENQFDTSKVKVHLHPIRVDYDEELKYISAETRDLIATKLQIRLHPIEALSEREKFLVHNHSRGNGIQLLSPDYVDSARPLLNGYQATTESKSLELLQKWLSTCVESHLLNPKGNQFCLPQLHDTSAYLGIQVIDVEKNTVIESNARDIEYAALSYVWGKDHTHDPIFEFQHGKRTDTGNYPLSGLPANIPKVIEDAIFVCKRISIPYLWVDRYCIDQADTTRKGAEIEGMGYRYLYAKITLIAGMEPEDGLLPTSKAGEFARLQRIETIQGRKYITALPNITDQIQSSPWNDRAWTMQEGQLANRCAFFGKYDISFLCGSGHWRESLHSGPYGHEAEMSDIDTNCNGYYLLSWLKWMDNESWAFQDYDSLLRSYSPRQLSFESDKVNAITGCLNVITERKGIPFIYGLPTTDFHYALLWVDEYDRPREGFPSWSWAGWHSLQQSHIIYPAETGTCSLEDDGEGNYKTVGPISRDIELEGLLIALTERPPRTNKCSQRFADITFPSHRSNKFLTITSEIAHFSLDILPSSSPPSETVRRSLYLEVPHDFNSTTTLVTTQSWDHSSEYRAPFARLRLRDSSNNTYQHHYPRWYDHWPPFKLILPSTLRGSTLAWLLDEGIEMVKILELELIEGDESLKPFHLVLCLGLDRREEVTRRCGMFCLPKEIWDKAHPKMGTVTLG
jgi:hypothetical protein